MTMRQYASVSDFAQTYPVIDVGQHGQLGHRVRGSVWISYSYSTHRTREAHVKR